MLRHWRIGIKTVSSLDLSLPPINVCYWKSKNVYYSSTELSVEVRTGLKNSRKAGLLDHLIPAFKTNSDVVETIIQLISSRNTASDYSDQALLTIFDLIQGWGGATGRWPYIVPQGQPHRPFNESFVDSYRKAVHYLFEMQKNGVNQQLIQFANASICELPRVGESFSSKHLLFWSLGLKLTPKLSIFDSRIKLLMAGSSSCKPSSISYIEFLNTLEESSSALDVPSEEYERALFAFSKNYFPNDSLKIKEEPLLAEDCDIALALTANSR
jgi:hypothetical protein